LDDIIKPNTKTFGKRIEGDENNSIEFPIKRIHHLDGKHLIVIDKSIAQKLNFFDAENAELYFQQELTEDSCIILRPFKVSG
jgi:hypothetical protein